MSRGFASMLSLPVATVRAFYLRQPQWRIDVFLRLCVILIATLTVTFFAVAIGWEGALPQSFVEYFRGYFADWLPFLPCILSVIWALVDIRYLLITRQRMPPTADLGANLLIWTALGPIIMFAIFGSVMWQSGHNGPLCNQTIDAWTLECKRVMRHVGGCQAVGIIGLVIMLVLHTYFFVSACKHIAAKRRAEKTGTHKRKASHCSVEVAVISRAPRLPQREPAESTPRYVTLEGKAIEIPINVGRRTSPDSEV